MADDVQRLWMEVALRDLTGAGKDAIVRNTQEIKNATIEASRAAGELGGNGAAAQVDKLGNALGGAAKIAAGVFTGIKVADLVKEGRIEEMKEAMLQASVDGAQTFDGHLHDLYRAGAITADTAVAFADSPNDVRLKIRLEGGAHAPATTIKIAR